jgi:hypothetical protein
MFLIDSHDRFEVIGLMIPTLRLPSDLVVFLNERYMPVVMSGYTAAFVNEGMSMFVVVSPSDNLSYVYILYIPYSQIALRQSISVNQRVDDFCKVHKINRRL